MILADIGLYMTKQETEKRCSVNRALKDMPAYSAEVEMINKAALALRFATENGHSCVNSNCRSPSSSVQAVFTCYETHLLQHRIANSGCTNATGHHLNRIRYHRANIGVMSGYILGLCWGYIGIMEKKMETTIVYWDYIGIMENKMDTTIVYWGYIGIMEKKMEATIGVI